VQDDGRRAALIEADLVSTPRGDLPDIPLTLGVGMGCLCCLVVALAFGVGAVWALVRLVMEVRGMIG